MSNIFMTIVMVYLAGGFLSYAFVTAFVTKQFSWLEATFIVLGWGILMPFAAWNSIWGKK